MWRIICLFLIWGATAAQAERPVTVFAAASLADVLREVADGWEGGQVVISAAGSSVLARQIGQGAPADVFISANDEWMEVLERERLIDAASRAVVARNALVLVGVAPDPGFVLADLPARLGSERLAVALVEAVPAGIYARQALMHAGIWAQIEPRLAQTDNVRAALALVARGEAPYGVVYATDAMAEPRVNVLAGFAPESHDPVTYPAAVVLPAREVAKAFLEYLQGPVAQAVFARHGFTAR